MLPRYINCLVIVALDVVAFSLVKQKTMPRTCAFAFFSLEGRHDNSWRRYEPTRSSVTNAILNTPADVELLDIRWHSLLWACRPPTSYNMSSVGTSVSESPNLKFKYQQHRTIELDLDLIL